jgi:hypothetical protein
MANHCQVITKKKMTPEKISALIDRLNATMFRDLLKIVYTDCTGKTGCWGNHVWEIETVNSNPKDPVNYGERVCWLNTSRHFEIRHGGGGNWIWWVDFAICNEVALEFDGYVSDDSDGEKYPGKKDKYADFNAYLIRSNIDDSFSDEVRNRKMKFIKSKFIQELIPPEFRWKKTPKR